MNIGFACIILALIILYSDKKRFSEGDNDNNPNNFGYHIKIYGGIVVLIIAGVINTHQILIINHILVLDHGFHVRLFVKWSSIIAFSAFSFKSFKARVVIHHYLFTVTSNLGFSAS